MSYAERIAADAASMGYVGANVRHVEAWMRLAHPTLDALSRGEFRREVSQALQCIAASGSADSEALARSFGI